MADRTVAVRLVANIGQYTAAMATAGRQTQGFGRQVEGTSAATEAGFLGLGRSAALMGAGIVAGLGLSAAAAISWGSAWAGVTKTVDGTEAEMAGLEDGLRGLARELPATHGEIAGVAEAAGALGIQTGAIEGFTHTMIDLGETTDLTADQAASGFARFANVMGTAQTDFDRLGSSVVDLGNNGASTESEILELGTRLAAAGHIAGLSEGDVLGFASALSSVGVEAEAGGTAFSKVFMKIRDAVLDGGEELEVFAQVAGVSAQQFAASFREDPAAAIESFVAGLGRMNDAGLSTSGVFDALELTDQRLMRATLSLSGAHGLLTDQLAIGNRGFEENTALQTEAEKRYATTAAQVEILRNQVVDFAISLGDQLLPFIRGVVDGLGTMVTGFAAIPRPLTLVLAGLGAAVVILPRLIALLRGLSTANLVLTGVLAAVSAVSYALGQNAKAAEEAEARIDGYTDAIRAAGNVADGVTAQLEDFLSSNISVAEVLEAAEVSADELGTALMGNDEAWHAFVENLMDVAEASGASQGELAGLVVSLGEQRTAAQGARDDAKTLNTVLGEMPGAAGAAEGAIGGTADAFETAEDAAKDAADAIKAYKDALRASFDPAFAMRKALEDQATAQWNLNAAMTDGESSAGDVENALWDLQAANIGVDEAAVDLSAAFNDGAASLEGFRASLDRWVYMGVLTADQANAIYDEFVRVRDVGQTLQPPGLFITADTSQAMSALNALQTKISNLAIMAGAKGQIYLTVVPGTRQASGGYAGMGSGDSGDTIPAMLTPGEFVIRAPAAAALGPALLYRLNRADTLGLAEGGYASYRSAPSGGGAGGWAPTVILNVAGHVITERDLVRTVRDGLVKMGAQGDRVP